MCDSEFPVPPGSLPLCFTFEAAVTEFLSGLLLFRFEAALHVPDQHLLTCSLRPPSTSLPHHPQPGRPETTCASRGAEVHISALAEKQSGGDMKAGPPSSATSESFHSRQQANLHVRTLPGFLDILLFLPSRSCLLIRLGAAHERHLRPLDRNAVARLPYH